MTDTICELPTHIEILIFHNFCKVEVYGSSLLRFSETLASGKTARKHRRPRPTDVIVIRAETRYTTGCDSCNNGMLSCDVSINYWVLFVLVVMAARRTSTFFLWMGSIHSSFTLKSCMEHDVISLSCRLYRFLRQ
jgi:hypothetical protein